jgi:drug/metabolite transporter (DMT)-like permease
VLALGYAGMSVASSELMSDGRVEEVKKRIARRNKTLLVASISILLVLAVVAIALFAFALPDAPPDQPHTRPWWDGLLPGLMTGFVIAAIPLTRLLMQRHDRKLLDRAARPDLPVARAVR